MTPERACLICRGPLRWAGNKTGAEHPVCLKHGMLHTWGVYDERGNLLLVAGVGDDHEHEERREQIKRRSAQRARWVARRAGARA